MMWEFRIKVTLFYLFMIITKSHQAPKPTMNLHFWQPKPDTAYRCVPHKTTSTHIKGTKCHTGWHIPHFHKPTQRYYQQHFWKRYRGNSIHLGIRIRILDFFVFVFFPLHFKIGHLSTKCWFKTLHRLWHRYAITCHAPPQKCHTSRWRRPQRPWLVRLVHSHFHLRISAFFFIWRRMGVWPSLTWPLNTNLRG